MRPAVYSDSGSTSLLLGVNPLPLSLTARQPLLHIVAGQNLLAELPTLALRKRRPTGHRHHAVEKPLPLLSVESRWRPNRPCVARQRRESKGRSGLDVGLRNQRYCTVNQYGTSTVQDHFPPRDYLEHDHITVQALGLSPEAAEALGIGYAPKGMKRLRSQFPSGSRPAN
jgi:hypothetical protein